MFEKTRFFLLCLHFCDTFIQIEQTSYNCQKAKAVQRTELNREVSIRRLEVGWKCNLNQIEGNKTFNGIKTKEKKTYTTTKKVQSNKYLYIVTTTEN